MVEEGYASVTARRVAAKAGLKPQLVHYYFTSMDDLLVNVVRRGAARSMERLQQALDSPQPLRAIWELCQEPSWASLSIELMALGNHREAVRAEIAAAAERFREAQRELLTSVVARSRFSPEELPVGALLMLLASLPRVTVLERRLGVTTGHRDLLALVEGYLIELEGDPLAPEAGAPAPSSQPVTRS